MNFPVNRQPSHSSSRPLDARFPEPEAEPPFSPPAASSPTQPAGLASGARGTTEPTPSTASASPGPAALNTRPRIASRRTAAVAAATFVVGGAVATGGFLAGQRTQALSTDHAESTVSAAFLPNDQPSGGSSDGTAKMDATRSESADPDNTAGTFDEWTLDDGGNVNGSERTGETDAFTSPSTSSLPAFASPAATVAELLGPSVVQVETTRGQGSGVVYADGLVLTNAHVVAEASRVQVRASDGEVFTVEVVGGDTRHDIAVLRVLTESGAEVNNALPVAQLGDSDDLRVGELAVAIGSPFALQQTVTSGIVSSLNRPVINETGTYSAQIQTDAAINPGNSGGALANSRGEVIGINSAIQTDGIGASNVGIGFAIPIDTAVRVADRIVAGEPLEAGVLGIAGGGSDGDLGVPIVQVAPGSGAQEAGLVVGDRLLRVDDAPVTSIDEVVGLIQSHFPGESVELTYLRDGEQFSTAATLGSPEQ